MSEILAAIIGAFVGFVSSFLVLRFDYKQLFAKVVSENRIEWMNSLRTNLSRFLANAEILGEMKKLQSCSFLSDGKCECEQYIQLKQGMFEARELVTTRLNLAKELQALLFAALKNLDNTSENFAVQREYIEDLARKILRAEWDSVKNEAKGKED